MNRLFSKFIAATAFAALAASAIANPISYTFSGSIEPGYGLDGQTINGSVTFDPSKFNGAEGDGATYSHGYTAWEDTSTPMPDGLMGEIKFTLSNGLTVETIDALLFTQMYVFKDPVGDLSQFIVQVFGKTSENQPIFLELLTQTTFDAGASIFTNGKSGDLSFDQPVVFNAPGTINVGYFNLSAPDYTPIYTSNFAISSVSIQNVAAIPEPQVQHLMLLGLVFLGVFKKINGRRSLIS
jgi:hypothetical protein